MAKKIQTKKPTKKATKKAPVKKVSSLKSINKKPANKSQLNIKELELQISNLKLEKQSLEQKYQDQISSLEKEISILKEFKTSEEEKQSEALENIQNIYNEFYAKAEECNNAELNMTAAKDSIKPRIMKKIQNYVDSVSTLNTLKDSILMYVVKNWTTEASSNWEKETSSESTEDVTTVAPIDEEVVEEQELNSVASSANIVEKEIEAAQSENTSSPIEEQNDKIDIDSVLEEI